MALDNGARWLVAGELLDDQRAAFLPRPLNKPSEQRMLEVATMHHAEIGELRAEVTELRSLLSSVMEANGLWDGR